MVRCSSSTACTMLAPHMTSTFAAGRAGVSAFCPSSRSLFPNLSSLEQHQQQQLQLSRAAAAGTSTLARRSTSSLGATRRRRGRSELLRCGLTRLSGDAGHKVLPVLATRDQWSHYWGSSDVQRVGKFFEVTAVAFLGLWACYFASFFLGVATMTVIGTSFSFYWLLAPNVTSFRRNRALRGRIAPFPGAEGNSIAIFRARVVGVTEEYHPVTGQPVFLRMVIEDEDGRALKFRTRTKREYARVRPGMVAEAVLVSPDSRFEEILGVSDTYIPAANVWVGEYPYLDKVVMRRLLASRDLKREQRRRRDSAASNAAGADDSQEYDDYDDYDEELDPMTYRDSWTQTQRQDNPPRRDTSLPPDHDSTSSSNNSAHDAMPGFDAYYGESEEDEEPYFEGVGSSGFSGVEGGGINGGTAARAEIPAGSKHQEQQQQQKQWERVSGTPRPRRRAPAAASRRFEAGEEDGGYYDFGGRRVAGKAGTGGGGGGEEGGGTTPFGAGEVRGGESRMAASHKRGGR